MRELIVLDSGPLGLLMQRRGLPLADACRSWLTIHLSAGNSVFVPQIADYEVRRELLRLRKLAAVNRLDQFNRASSGRYLRLTTAAMRQAADLWAQIRQKGLPTADPKEIDADVIVAAQGLTSDLPAGDLIIATTNPIHLNRFVAAELWENI